MLAKAGINPHYSPPLLRGETKRGPEFRVALVIASLPGMTTQELT
jgi:hypothetical protein